MLPVIKACEKIDNLKYSVVLSGSHVRKKSILNNSEVKQDNLKNIIKLDYKTINLNNLSNDKL